MAFVYADRVKETSTTTGTGTMILSGSVAGFRSFSDGVGLSNETFYTIVADDNTWEVGRGTVGSGTLSRDTVLSSSNSGLPVNFAVGNKTVFATAAASFFDGAIDTAQHSALDHTGIPGVPPAESFTSTAHDAVDHTASPFDLLDAAAHAAIDHSTGITGIVDATAGSSGGVKGLITLDSDQGLDASSGVASVKLGDGLAFDGSGNIESTTAESVLFQDYINTTVSTGSAVTLYTLPANTITSRGQRIEIRFVVDMQTVSSATGTLTLGGVNLMTNWVASSDVGIRDIVCNIWTSGALTARVVAVTEAITTTQASGATNRERYTTTSSFSFGSNIDLQMFTSASNDAIVESLSVKLVDQVL